MRSFASEIADTCHLLHEAEAFPVGTVRTWDGEKYRKQPSGEWKYVPDWTGAGTKVLPPGLAKVPSQPPPRATPEKLPESPWRYFKKTAKAVLIPLDKLQTIRARPEGIANAEKFMAAAYNGEKERRKPVSLKKNEDGTYTVLDGNSTTAIARKHGWSHVAGEVEENVLRRLVGRLKGVLAEMTWQEKQHPRGGDPDNPGRFSKKVGRPSARTGKYQVVFTPSHSLKKWLKKPAKRRFNIKPEKKTVVDRLLARAELLIGLRQKIDTGKLAPGVSFREHVQRGAAFLAKHAAGVAAGESRLKKAVPKGEVSFRVKDLESALGKLVRKPAYATAEKLQDGTGFRVTVKNLKEAWEAVEAIRKEYKGNVISEENILDDDAEVQKRGGYRSYHFVVRDADGLDKEIQVRTPNQNCFGDWCHNIYKPQTHNQKVAYRRAAPVIQEYAKKVADVLWARDNGRNVTLKDCPSEVEVVFGCPPCLFGDK